ncbi:hypothetical protein B0J13DRAFT_57169 [Dactylonectria estremocensis]|uniref:2EXR domain-containing protein n=1 Tax=Dactylonectria estremocensis TaxID=1079267 RepID=A0A9P9EQG4_9HYPO|nr:hypothetical protein B0J13DRAFT_57169 [Dactylonectria estremocensis]
MDPNAELSISSAEHSFSRFSDLPSEIRNRIWHLALDNAAHDRVLHVAIQYLYYVVNHSCCEKGLAFCGNHAYCPSYISIGEASKPSICMADGYFSTSDQHPELEGMQSKPSLGALSLACYESRQVVLSRYPQVLRIYRGKWHSSMQPRLVRFCPETDVLLITTVSDTGVAHPHATIGKEDNLYQYIENYKTRFPGDADRFQSFRETIASAEHVAFRHMGHRGAQFYGAGCDVASQQTFIHLLFFFESLKHLFMWPDPAYWPEVLESTVRIENIKDLVPADNADKRFRWLQNNACEVLYRHLKKSSEAQNRHVTESQEHWVPTSKPIEHIGCYIPEAWLSDP